MKFALITEGPSEHRVIKHIISKFLKDQAPEINQIQPKIVNDKQETVGGWNEVLKYCERKELVDIFIENDFLVIQIDTDQSQTAPFSVQHSKTNPETGQVINKSQDELYNDVVEKLKSLIPVDILNEYGDRIIFAISSHTIECWLLPIYYTNNHKSDHLTCLSSLNTELRKKNIKQIPFKDKNSMTSIRTYDTILKNWNKRKNIEVAAEHQFRLKEFLKSLKKLESE